MRPTRRHRRLRCLSRLEWYNVLAALGVLLFVLLANSFAASIEHDIVTAAQTRSLAEVSPSGGVPSVTFLKINTRSLGEQGLQHARDVVSSLWTSLTQVPLAKTRMADLAYLLGSATFPGLPAKQSDALIDDLATETDDVFALAALTTVVSLANDKTAVHLRLQDELKARAVSRPLSSPFEASLVERISARTPSWQSEADESLREQYEAAAPPPLAEHLELYEQILIAWELGGRQNNKLKSAYQNAVERLVVERVRTQPSTNFTTVGGPAVLGESPPSPSPFVSLESCRVAGLLAVGVRLGIHPIHLDTAAKDANEPSAQLNDQAVLDVAESLAASCTLLSSHNVSAATGFVEASTTMLTHSCDGVDSVAAGVDSAEAQQRYHHEAIVTMLRTWYELYLTTRDELYATWALRAFSASSVMTAPTADALTRDAASAIVAYTHELRYFSCFMHALYCAQHLPVRQEKAMCSFHERTVRMQSGYAVTIPR